MMLCRALQLSLLTAALSWPSGAYGATLLGPTPYVQSADSPFSEGGSSYFYLENFEDGVLSTPGVVASGGIVLAPDALRDSVDEDDGAVDGSGTGGFNYYSNGSSALRFTFNAAILGQLPTHAGLVWTDVGFEFSGTQNFIGDVEFEAFDAMGNSLGVIGPVTLGDGLVTGGTAEDRFFGVRNSGGISAIELRMPNSGDWEMDHLQYGAAAPVPEPATAALLGAGLAVVLCGARRARMVRGGRPLQ